MVSGLDEFLRDYPGMAIQPTANAGLELRGTFAFCGESENHPVIADAYELNSAGPPEFRAALPRVTETGGRIPRDGDHHVNPGGTLCLGSPLRLLLTLSRQPTLDGFATTCLVPYLYAISHKRQHGGPFVFDELAHGAKGALRDYKDLFRLQRPEQAERALRLLGMKKRQANRQPCPCGCGRRVGGCRFNARLRKFRMLAPRAWFRAQIEVIDAERRMRAEQTRAKAAVPAGAVPVPA
jgi:hypothetical protein